MSDRRDEQDDCARLNAGAPGQRQWVAVLQRAEHDPTTPSAIPAMMVVGWRWKRNRQGAPSAIPACERRDRREDAPASISAIAATRISSACSE